MLDLFFHLNKCSFFIKSLSRILAGFFLYFLTNNVYALNYAAYYFNYEPEKTPGCIQVALSTKADNDGKAVFKLPENVDIFYVQNPGAKGGALPGSNRIAIVQLKPNEQVILRYESCFINYSKTIYTALYDKNLLFFAHGSMLILPLGKNLDEEWQYFLDYSKLPENFHVVSSHPIVNKTMNVVMTLGEFEHTATLAGLFTPKVLAFDDKNDKPIQYIQLGNWDWFKETPEFYIRKLLSYQRKFWQDDDSSDYSIAFSTQEKTPYFNGIQGVHFKNFIALSIAQNNENIPDSIMGISHELFHGWIGNKAFLKYPLESVTWFLEGFTDYYANRFALEAETITFSDYINNLNKNLIRFYASPIRDMSRDQALENYDPDKYVYQFELIKGSLVAHKMAKLKDENNNRIIDKTIKSIYFKIKDNKALSEKEQKSIIWDEFNQALGKEQWAEYEKFLNTQNQFKLSESDFDFPTKIKIKTFKLPHYHFDMTNFIIKREIKDLVTNSPEYKAGLRNGMKIIQHNITFHRAADEISLLLEDENKVQRTIKFKPKLKTHKIPQLIK